MKILKNKTIKTEAFEKLEPFDYLINGIREGKSYTAIAEENGIKVPTLQKRVESFFSALEDIEPTLLKLSQEFDTYFDLKVIHKDWVNIVAKYMVLKTKCFRSSLDTNILLNKKLKHRKIKISPEGRAPYESVQMDFFKPFEKKIPIRVSQVATELCVNTDRLQWLFDNLFKKITTMDGWALSSRRSLFKAIINFGMDAEIKYCDSLENLYIKFNTKYTELFKSHNVFSYDDFLTYIKDDVEIFDSFIKMNIDSNQCEILCFLEKNNLAWTECRKKRKKKKSPV